MIWDGYTTDMKLVRHHKAPCGGLLFWTNGEWCYGKHGIPRQGGGHHTLVLLLVVLSVLWGVAYPSSFCGGGGRMKEKFIFLADER